MSSIKLAEKRNLHGKGPPFYLRYFSKITANKMESFADASLKVCGVCVCDVCVVLINKSIIMGNIRVLVTFAFNPSVSNEL